MFENKMISFKRFNFLIHKLQLPNFYPEQQTSKQTDILDTYKHCPRTSFGYLFQFGFLLLEENKENFAIFFCFARKIKGLFIPKHVDKIGKLTLQYLFIDSIKNLNLNFNCS